MNYRDGWAPIDKKILVGIVERLSVSCLQPTSSTSSSSSVQTEAAPTAGRCAAPSDTLTTQRGSAGRRKRRVQVRDTWPVPTGDMRRRAPTSSSTPAGRASSAASASARHVWAPLDKSVILSVVEQVLVDEDASGRSESRSPSLHHSAQTHQLDQASFKWKSNILRRMRKEQTVVAAGLTLLRPPEVELC